jgi:HNH endonuclease
MNNNDRLLLRIRAQHLCEYCLSPEDCNPDIFPADHVIPKAKGGINDLINRALACWRCNSLKSDFTEALDPATGEFATLYNPRTHLWADHFCWDESFTLLLGISPIGRATILKLQLNRASVVKLRGILFRIGEHPIQIN